MADVSDGLEVPLGRSEPNTSGTSTLRVSRDKSLDLEDITPSLKRLKTRLGVDRFVSGRDVVLRIEYISEIQARLLIATLWIGSLLGFGLCALLLYYIISIKIRCDRCESVTSQCLDGLPDTPCSFEEFYNCEHCDLYFFEHNWPEQVNVGVAAALTVATLTCLGAYAHAAWHLRFARRQWTRLQRRLWTLAIWELVFSLAQTLCFLAPNVHILISGCAWFDLFVLVFMFLRWTAINSVCLIWLVSGHNMVPRVTRSTRWGPRAAAVLSFAFPGLHYVADRGAAGAHGASRGLQPSGASAAGVGTGSNGKWAAGRQAGGASVERDGPGGGGEAALAGLGLLGARSLETVPSVDSGISPSDISANAGAAKPRSNLKGRQASGVSADEERGVGSTMGRLKAQARLAAASFKRQRAGRAVETVGDLPWVVHAPKLLIWCLAEAAVCIMVFWHPSTQLPATSNHTVPMVLQPFPYFPEIRAADIFTEEYVWKNIIVPIKQGKATAPPDLPDADLGPVLDAEQCSQWLYSCQLDSLQLHGASWALGGCMLVYFVLFLGSIRATWVRLQVLPYAQNRVQNILVRLAVRVRVIGVFFIAIPSLMVWFIQLSPCTSLFFAWPGLLPLQVVMGLMSVLWGCLFLPFYKPEAIVQAGLHEFAWTEEEKPTKMAALAARAPRASQLESQAVFCFETSTKLMFWAILAYRYVKAGGEWVTRSDELPMEDGLSMWGLASWHVYQDAARDSLVLTGQSRRVLVVSFRGTASRANLLVDFQVVWTAHPPARGNFWKGTRPMVHRGFLFMWNGIKHDIMQHVREFLEQAEDPSTCQIYLTGHSLGGALATLAAVEIRREALLGPGQIFVYTFGAPRVGNHVFAQEYTQLVPDTWHIINDQDMVVREGKFVRMYKRAGHRVIINGRGDMIVRPRYVELTLNRVPAMSSLAHHKMSSYRASMATICRAHLLGRKVIDESGIDAVCRMSAAGSWMARFLELTHIIAVARGGKASQEDQQEQIEAEQATQALAGGTLLGSVERVMDRVTTLVRSVPSPSMSVHGAE